MCVTNTIVSTFYTAHGGHVAVARDLARLRGGVITLQGRPTGRPVFFMCPSRINVFYSRFFLGTIVLYSTQSFQALNSGDRALQNEVNI
jgi:hypothetical protein